MTKRKRRNRSPSFKAKVAMAGTLKKKSSYQERKEGVDFLLHEHQVALDLVNIPTRQELRCRYQRICW